jgi:hypothetical protein
MSCFMIDSEDSRPKRVLPRNCFEKWLGVDEHPGCSCHWSWLPKQRGLNPVFQIDPDNIKYKTTTTSCCDIHRTSPSRHSEAPSQDPERRTSSSEVLTHGWPDGETNLGSVMQKPPISLRYPPHAIVVIQVCLPSPRNLHCRGLTVSPKIWRYLQDEATA